MNATTKQKIRWTAEYGAARLLIGIVQLLSPYQADQLSKFLAWLFADVIRIRAQVSRENLQAAFPHLSPLEISAMIRQMWYHLIRMGCEIVLAPRKVHQTNWRKYVYIRDVRAMTERLIDYRPLVGVAGHYGNFEMAGFVIGLLGMSSYTVARTLDNPYLDHFINEFRQTYGQYILPKEGSAPHVQRVLHSGGILGFLGDQHAGNQGCWIDFFSRPASCHKAVALFTLEGQAPMMVSYCRHRSKLLHFEIGCAGIADPADLPDSLRDIKALTQWYSDRLADIIQVAPAQYWWLHRRWKEKSVRAKRVSQQAAA